MKGKIYYIPKQHARGRLPIFRNYHKYVFVVTHNGPDEAREASASIRWLCLRFPLIARGDQSDSTVAVDTNHVLAKLAVLKEDIEAVSF